MLRFSDAHRVIRAAVFAAAVCAVLLAANRPADCPSAAITTENLTLEEGKVALIHAINEDEKFLDTWLAQRLLFLQEVVTGQDVNDAAAEKNQATQKLELAVIDLAKTYLSFLKGASHIEVVDAYQSIDEESVRHMSLTVQNVSESGMAEDAHATLRSSYEALDKYIKQRQWKLKKYKLEVEKLLEAQKNRPSGLRDELIINRIEDELSIITASINDPNAGAEFAYHTFGQNMNSNKITKDQVNNLLTIKDLYVSVTVGNVAVTDPIEQYIPELKRDQPKTLKFTLNQEVEDVTINLQYKEVRTSHNVKLKRKQEKDLIEVESRSFAQEGVLGNWVNYDIALSRLAEDEKTFRLEVVNLPPEFRYQFTEGGNTLSRIKFTRDSASHALTLKVMVPENLADSYLNKRLSFFALVGSETSIEGALRDYKDYGDREADNLHGYPDLFFVELDLTPKGTGKIDMNFTNLYHEFFVGEKLKETFTIENTGSVILRDIRFKLEAPGKFEVKFKPEEIAEIAPREKVKVTITVEPPGDVEVGKYEVKVWAECDHEGMAIETGKKNISIKINAKTNATRTFMLVGILILVVLAVAVFTIRLSRR